jgi:hypothetical protein
MRCGAFRHYITILTLIGQNSKVLCVNGGKQQKLGICEFNTLVYADKISIPYFLHPGWKYSSSPKNSTIAGLCAIRSTALIEKHGFVGCGYIIMVLARPLFSFALVVSMSRYCSRGTIPAAYPYLCTWAAICGCISGRHNALWGSFPRMVAILAYGYIGVA